MWKTWALSTLLAASVLSGCSCTNPGSNPSHPPGSTPGGGTNPDGGVSGGGSDGGTDGGMDGGLEQLGSLSLEPQDATIQIQGNTPATRQYTVTGTFLDGHTEDLTAVAVFSLDNPQLGSFGGNTFTSGTTQGGSTVVRARVDSMSTSTGLSVQLQQRLPDSAPESPTLPAEPETKFGGQEDAARKPQLVYPNNGVLVPPNLGELEIHFLPGPATNTLFELAFTNAVTDVRVYLRCYLPSGFSLPSGVSSGCIYTPSSEVWSFLSRTNRGGQPVQLTLRATGDDGGTVGVSDPLSIQFARTELKGALYYWTTSGNTGIVRYDFAAEEGQTASMVLTKNNIQTSVNCVGCHALSRNGKKLVAEVNGQDDGRLALVDLSTFDSANDQVPLAQGGTKLSIFESWNPTGTQFVGSYADSGATNYNLRLFNGDTATIEGEISGTGTSNNPADHPDWSADGQKIAYTHVGGKGTLQRMYKGAIELVTAQAGGGWSAPVTVVPTQNGKNRYYPAIAPDSTFLVYNESTCPSGTQHKDCNADSDPSAKLWAAKLEASAQPVELARANAPGVMDGAQTNLTNSYPKWSPFVTRGIGGDSSRLMWLTTSSSRMYGLRQAPSGSSENPKGTLLWMAAVDPDKLMAGEDPSYPAFALPFQDLGTSNHIAQWAEYFVSNGCATSGEGCGGETTCCNGLQCVQLNQDPPIPCDVAGACECKPIPQCALESEPCSVAAACCDGLLCVNASGQECTGNDCSCKPPCSGLGELCGANAPCCNSMSCTTTANGNVCKIILQ